MNHLPNLRVLVLGLGDSGLAMARWCARFGAQVQVWDSRESPPQAATLAEEVPAAVLHRGAVFLDVPAQALSGVQLVLKSPGLAPDDERIAPLLALARQIGVPVQGELDLFALALADLKTERRYVPDVLAITGTNGKTTTATLTALLVRRAGRRVALAGNVGPTMLDTLAAALELEPVIVSDFGELDEADEAPLPAAAEHGVVEQALAAGASPVDTAEAPATADGVETSEFSALDALAEPGAGPADTDAGTEADPAADSDGVAGGIALADDELGDEGDDGDGDGDNAAERPAASTAQSEPAAARELAAEASGDAKAAVTVAGEPAADAPGAADDMERPLPIAPPPPRGPVFEHLPEVWVLELSSFQLDEVRGFEPTAGVVLNLTQDHLDWHGTLEAYGAAKARIYGKTSTVIVTNRDDAAVVKMAARAEAGEKAPVKPGSRGRVVKPVPRKLVEFGLEAPTRPGDFGVLTQNGMAWLVRALETDETIKRRRGAEPDDLSIQRLMPADALLIRGRHNASNALAALALATSIGCPLAPMLHGLRQYRGEPHRVQFVATIGGVDAFDDSKGTNVGATVAALGGLGADRAPSRLVVILGGDGKGQDFEPLQEPVRRHVRAVATIGRDAGRIEEALAQCIAGDALMCRHDTLEAATRWAFTQARPGDAVLLSPACASLDMFRNYAHRADVFVAEVQAIAQEMGEVS